MQAYSNLSNSMEVIELQAAARLMDTKFATETAELMKNRLINKYAHSMVSKANDSERDNLLVIL
jgi:flagellin-like hook-associated protein FlgL